MAKYLCQASYTPEGMRGLIKDKASGRKAAVQAAIRAAGGRLESFYYAFGKDDVVLIVDLPDNATAAGFLASIPSVRSMMRWTASKADWFASLDFAGLRDRLGML